jgi:23S rRNA pseudouridine2605 synthase
MKRPKPTRRKTKSDAPDPARPLRLQKIIADAGLASRRRAETWIEEGQVTVNGVVASLGDKAVPDKDLIRVNGRMLPEAPVRKLTLAVNKPRGWICSNYDPLHEKTVFDLLPPNLQSQRLFCAGRLDLDSEGLLILTNDGDLAQRLTHPSAAVIKKYRLRLHRPLDPADIPRLIKGRKIENEWYKVDRVVTPPGPATPPQNLEVHLSHGKKREIRVLFEAMGYHVKRLKRIQIGGFLLKGVPLGGYSVLGPREVERLFQT